MSFDPAPTVLTQYANSPILLGLLARWCEALDAEPRLLSWLRDVWNLDTARGWGLDVWGRIVGVGRVLHLDTPAEYLGFEGTDNNPFGGGVWYSGSTTTTNYALSDDAYRLLIYAKAAANLSNGSAQSLNLIVRRLFPGTGARVRDNLDMTMEYRFATLLTPVQRAIVTQSGVLPKPAGVSVTVAEGV